MPTSPRPTWGSDVFAVDVILGVVTKEQVVQNAIDAISLGSLYALFALGIALIFGIMGLVNFAHGELIMVGAYGLVLLSDLPLAVKAVVSALVVVAFALAMERMAFRPVRGASPATLLVTSFAVSYLLQNLAILIFGATTRSTSVSSVLSGVVSVGSFTIPVLSILTVGLTVLLVAGLALFLSRTTVGVQMRAAAENFQIARLLGVRANTVIAVAFAASGLLAAAAAFLLTTQTGTVTPTVGVNAVLVAFIATVIGGLGSLIGAVLGGFVIASLTVALQAALPLELRPYRDAFVFGIVLAILVLRPQGLIVSKALVARVDAVTASAVGRATAASGHALRSLAGRSTTLLLLAAVVVTVSMLGSLGPGSLDRTVVTFLVNLILVVGLYMFVGNSGVFSFGHMSFMAIGAYTAAILVIPQETKETLFATMPGFLQDASLPPIAATLVGGAVAAAAAAVLAVPLMRISGLTAALATFAVLIIVNVVARNWKEVTNASAGMSGIPASTDVVRALLFALGALVLAFVFQQTRSCLRLRGSREDELAARAIGVGVARERGISFVLSAFVVGAAGGLYAQSLGTIQPDAFYLSLTFLTVAMLVVGGLTSLSGAVIGTLVLSAFSEVLRRFEQGIDFGPVTADAPTGLREIGFALCLLAILVLRPAGIMGGREIVLPARPGELLRRLRQPHEEAPADGRQTARDTLDIRPEKQ